MIWRSREFVLLFVFLLIGTSLSKSLENTNDGGPSSSSSIRDEDQKVSSSISQLLRSLESPTNNDQQQRPTQIITKHGIMTATPGRTDKNGRKLYFGDPEEHITGVSSGVPAPVVVSSQAITIAGSSSSNGTGGNKRGRSLQTASSASSSVVDKDGVRTIEGVRVPDDEHDKFYTWRNARVIKNFLVPNDRPANPQRKRQILIQDARSYLTGASQQQQATLIDASSLQQQQQQPIYYSQTQPQQQQQQHSQTNILQGQDLTAALYAAAAAQQQVGQQYAQYAATAPSASGQQAAAAAATAYNYNPQQGQMYVLQPDGKTYLPYSPAQLAQSSAASATATVVDQTAHHHQQQNEPQQQQQQYPHPTQFASRSGEVDTSSSEQSQPNYQQAAAAIQRYQQQLQLQQLKKQQQEQEYQQHILSKHQSHLIQQHHHQQQQEQEAVAQAQAQAEAAQKQAQQAIPSQAPHVSVIPLSGQGALSDNATPTPLLHKTAAVMGAQNLASIAATAIPTGASIGQQLQEQVSIQTAQTFNLQQPQLAAAAAAQHHPNGQLIPISGAVYHIPQAGGPAQVQIQQQPQPAILEDRNGNGGPMAVNPNQFVIQPQTYLSGGQVFTVPVPIPADQIGAGSEQQQHVIHHHQHNNNNNHQRERHNNRDREREHNRDREENSNKKEGKSTYANRLMESLQINKKAMERIDTSGIVVPVLTTAGIFLGFGALAAGWYLSKSNREVGILRRTGKPSPTSSSSLSGLSTHKSSVDKDHAILAHLARRKRSTPDEVDQASFFQSIIQHGIEKQQVKFEDPEPAPAPTAQSTSSRRPSYDNYQSGPVKSYQSSYNSHSSSENSKVTRTDRVDDGHHNTDRHGKGGHRGKGGGHISKVKTFAKVAIPAVILGGSVVIIGALIFGWYVSGKNREIAFLEPSAYSRRKRSLATSNSNSNFAQTVSDNGWLSRTLTAIHTNPYETEALPPTRKSTTLITDSDLTQLAVIMGMAALAIGSMVVLFLAIYITDSGREVGWADSGPYTFGQWPTIHKHHPYHRVHRSVSTNQMTLDLPAHNNGFLHKILDNLEVSQSSLLNKLQENGAYDKWQETPCAKRIFCDIMSAQGDDTIRMMEKRMTKFLTMLPDSLTSSLAQTLGDVMTSINKRDCSAYTCGGHSVDPTATIPQLASVPAPRR